MSIRLLTLILGFMWSALAHAQVVEYVHTDALGSPVAITNEAGQVIERSDYEPYGSMIGKANNDRPGYTGHVMDSATGLTYMQQRYYDPTIGRFLSTDPVQANASTGASFNRYDYANNNPYRFKDPDGRATTCTGSGNDKQCTTTADTFNPAKSTHQTVVASPEVKAAVEQGKSAVAVQSGSREKLGFVVPGKDGKLTVKNSSGTRTARTTTGATARSSVPGDAVAGVHGHIDSIPSSSMVDDPESNGGYGDTQSIKLGIPMATVSRGQVGWHEMRDGRLEFSYPASAVNETQAQQIQDNLNAEQSNFQQGRP